MTPFILKASRLIIRAFQPDDLHAIHRILDFAFQQLCVKRLIATTEHDNAASMGVMRKLGMTIAKNPFPDPPWLQVVGILDQPASKESTRG